jgi:hypothetical protein
MLSLDDIKLLTILMRNPTKIPDLGIKIHLDIRNLARHTLSKLLQSSDNISTTSFQWDNLYFKYISFVNIHVYIIVLYNFRIARLKTLASARFGGAWFCGNGLSAQLAA